MARVAKRNKDYWKKRMSALEDEQYQRSGAYYRDVQKQFRMAANDLQMEVERWYQRLADNNDISYAAAKRLLKANDLEEFHWTVEQYIKAGEENAVDQRWMKELENASARHHISYLDTMKLQIQQHAELLSTEFEGGLTDFLHKSYGEQYYHTAYEVAKGTGIGTNLARLDDRQIDAIIKRPWAQDGANFSDRIWTNKQKLVNSLHTELTQSVIRGADARQATHNLSKTMEVSRAQAGRLIMTESAAFSSAAQKDCLNELGVEKYEILATLDSHTSEICRELDGKVFEMKDYEVGSTAPPFHPWCRSTTIPYFDDEFTEDEERTARDEETGKTYYVPASMKYKEWEERYAPQIQKFDEIAVLKRNSKQLEQRGRDIKEEIEKHSSRKSKWSGTILVDNERCDQFDCFGQKEWNCDILLRDDVSDGVILHELLHSCSASYFTSGEYLACRMIEESSVELLTQELAGVLGIRHMPTYAKTVNILRNVNAGLGLYENDMEFAVELFNKPMNERFTWLQNRVNECIIHNNKVSLEEAEEIMDYIAELGG